MKDKDGVTQPVKARDYPNYDDIQYDIHSATSYDITKHIFLFDTENVYVIKNNPYTLKVYKDVYCVGVLSFTKSYNYALIQ